MKIKKGARNMNPVFAIAAVAVVGVGAVGYFIKKRAK